MLSVLDIGTHKANVQFRWFCRMACCLPPIWKEREGVTNEEVSLEWRWREKKTLFLLLSNNNTFRWAIFPWCIAFDVHSLGCFTFFRPHFIVLSVSHKDIRALQEWKSQTRRAKKWGGGRGVTRAKQNTVTWRTMKLKTSTPLIVGINVYCVREKVFWSRCCHFHYGCAC